MSTAIVPIQLRKSISIRSILRQKSEDKPGLIRSSQPR